MSRRTSYGALLLILLLLPTPALCTICAAEGCEMETAAEDCPRSKPPDDCCGEMPAMDHGSHAAEAMPRDHGMPMGHDCASHSRRQPIAADAGDCCAAAGRAAEVPVSAAPALDGEAMLVEPAHTATPGLAADAAGVPSPRPLAAARSALFTLHRSLLI